MEWLKHAFAVEHPGPFEPTEAQRPVVERVCGEVVRRGLTTPAIMALEMSRPLNFVGSQALHFFSPLISALTDAQGHKQFAEFLEHRGSIEYLCRRMEQLDAERRNGTEEVVVVSKPCIWEGDTPVEPPQSETFGRSGSAGASPSQF